MQYNMVPAKGQWCSVAGKVTMQSSLKFIGTDTDRSATYDFLLMFHGKNGPNSYRFGHIRQFQSKITNYSHLPCI